MAENDDKQYPADKNRHSTEQDTMRVVQSDDGSKAAWFVAAAVVIALLIVAFVVGSDRGSRSTSTAPAPAPEAVETDAPEAEPAAAETAGEAPEATIDLEDRETAPPDEAALPPATEPETVPDEDAVPAATDTAN